MTYFQRQQIIENYIKAYAKANKKPFAGKLAYENGWITGLGKKIRITKLKEMTKTLNERV